MSVTYQGTQTIVEGAPLLTSRTEAHLLWLAGGFVLVNFAALTLIRPENWLSHLLCVLIWVLSAVVSHRVLRLTLPGHDVLLLPVVLFLSGWGLAAIERLAPRFGDRQALWLALSVMVMLAVASFPRVLYWLRNYRYVWLVLGLGLLISTILLGRNPTGQIGAPQLWLGFGGLYFQPSEALKVILVAFLASYLGEQYPAMRTAQPDGQRLALSPRIYGPILLMWGLSVVVLVWQRDLGTAILFFMVFLILLYVASGNTLILLSGALLITAAAFVAYRLFSVVQLRIDIWLNPWPEAEGRAFQLVQSLQAFASGGIFGQGIGQGAPYYIPVVHSDFIFAAIAEEWGLLGCIVVVICIALLTMRGLRIALLQQGRPFRTLLAVGLSSLIGIQSLMIMGGVLRVFPLTGVTLPFVSYGGSSLLMSFIIVGILLRLSVEAQQPSI
ncbi:MAG: FtsW/RodA/SpoVE family cell cycle protein [bacterium]|nr:FtsW/RodA/SpoVE family cell cycle protein [bacterium]